MRKFLSFFLVASMFFASIPTIVSAEDVNNIEVEYKYYDEIITSDIVERIEDMLSQARQTSRFGLSDFETLEIGTRLNSYVLRDGVQLLEDIYYYPIMNNGNIVSIITVYGEKGSHSISLGANFAERLQAFLQNNESVAMLHMGDNLYAVSPFDKVVVQSFPGATNPEEVQFIPFSLNQMLDFAEVDTLINIDMVSVDKQNLSRNYVVRLNVPSKLQGNTNLCWAASVASVGQYHTGIGSVPF